MSELLSFQAQLVQIPSTLTYMLGVYPPDFIPGPINEVVELFGAVDRIVVVLIDNFGLFETTMYKPQFLIEYSNALVLLATRNPYTLGVLQQVMYGGFEREVNGYHFLRYLNQNERTTLYIGRQRDIERYDGNTPSVAKNSDMATWIEAAKVINRTNLTLVHFLDFEDIHRKQARMGRSPEALIEKLIRRTDKWILSMYKQLRSNSLMIILGDHGRYKMDFSYSGKIAEWRQASVPVAIFVKKE
ncbi:MAG: hypothetical protein Kow0069_05820 [Promethearchaeota archaeon]